MPHVDIYLYPGRTVEMKKQLAKSVSKAVAEALKIDIKAVRMIIHDTPRENWYDAGESLS